MATSLYKAQVPFRKKGQTTCVHHKGTELEFYCEDCTELSCINCVSTIHKSHSLCSLSELTPEAKKDIKIFIDKTENIDLPQIDQSIISSDTLLMDNISHFEELSHRLKMQANKLKDDLDVLTAKTLSNYHQMAEDNNNIIQRYQQDLERYSTQRKQQVEECKIALHGGSSIQIHEAGREIHSSVKIPVRPNLHTASFTPKANPEYHLEKALGKVTTSDERQGLALQTHGRFVGSSAGQRISPAQRRSELEGRTPSIQQRASQKSKTKQEMSSPIYSILPNAKVLKEWNSQCFITSVCPSADGHVWTSDNRSSILTLSDVKGNVMQEVQHSVDISDVSLSSITNTLWFCDNASNIIELVSGRPVHRFSTRKEPLCICITSKNHVIVGMRATISKFTKTGKLLLAEQADKTGKPLVFLPYRISECPVTFNVAVVDMDRYNKAREASTRIVIMDANFRELFVYGGDVPNIYQTTPHSEAEEFEPWGVAFDGEGNIVVGDYINRRVVLLNGRGKFLSFLYRDRSCTNAICVDSKGILWAVFGFNNVKLLDYLS